MYLYKNLSPSMLNVRIIFVYPGCKEVTGIVYKTTVWTEYKRSYYY